MPPAWEKAEKGFFNKVWDFYLGPAKSSPGIHLAETLMETKQNPVPYLLFHADLVEQVPPEEQARLKNNFRLAIENVSRQPLKPPIMIFDPSHYLLSPHRHPEKDIAEIYRQLEPEVLHVGFDYPPLLHALPKPREQRLLLRMLKLWQPRYIVIETNPAVSVKKAKTLLEDIVASTG